MLAMMLSGKCGQVMNNTAGAEEFPQPAQKNKGVLLLSLLLPVRNKWLDAASTEVLLNMSGNSFSRGESPNSA